MPKEKIEEEVAVGEVMPPSEIRNAIAVLDQELFNHSQWTDALNITLICRLRPDERDMSPRAHRECRFGQWYYSDDSQVFHDNPNFKDLEEAHQSMHECAAHLLTLSSRRQQIPMTDYEQFAHELKRMRLQIETLKRELEDEIHNIDPLTGATSRLSMLTKLREQQELVKRKLETCVIVMMDIDKFKLINDKYGHLVGDRTLTTFAHHVMRHTRPFDRLFRYGGEEFLLCLPHTDIEKAHNIVERVRTELEATDIIAEGHQPFHITASFGLTVLDPDTPILRSIDRADIAAYAAKERGRNQTVIWDASMEKRKVS